LCQLGHTTGRTSFRAVISLGRDPCRGGTTILAVSLALLLPNCMELNLIVALLLMKFFAYFIFFYLFQGLVTMFKAVRYWPESSATYVHSTPSHLFLSMSISMLRSRFFGYQYFGVMYCRHRQSLSTEATCSSETLVHMYRSTWRHISEY
jgi:hypothetical protein